MYLLILKHFVQIIALIFRVLCIIYIWGIFMGIHYDYKSTKSAKLMEKQAKRERKLAEKRAKKQAKTGSSKEKEQDKTIPLDQIITLDHLTDPDKK